MSKYTAKPHILSSDNLERLDHLTSADLAAQVSASNASALMTAMTDFDPLRDDELTETQLNLSDYLATVQMVVKETFSHSVWVRAEIRNLSSKSGHYYFELAEKDKSGKVVASCRGNLWKFKASSVLRKFERATGMALKRDVTVLLNVTANVHPLYGFSLTINDIDPSYTLSDLARQYTAIIEKLSGEGLLNLNKQLPNPFDIEYVLVIAPENAAGLGDFRADADKLSATGACYFDYHYSTFQSNTAPKEMRYALTQGMKTFREEHARLPDLIVIIRGGGAVGDLAYLNDYELAALVAEQPVPVWVGVGHERDRVILDEVAHTSFDTPSKVIAAIIEHLAQLMRHTQSLSDQITQRSREQLNEARRNSDSKFNSIKNQSSRRLERWQYVSSAAFDTIKQQAKFQLREVVRSTETYASTVKQLSYQHLTQAQEDSNQTITVIQTRSQQQLSQAAQQVQHYRELTLVQHPARLLQQGYAMVKTSSTNKLSSDKTGTDTKTRYVTSVQQLELEQTIDVIMQDGSFTAVVQNKTINNNADV